MECEKEVHLSGSSSQSELKYDSMSELAGDAEDLEMSEKRDVLEEMPVITLTPNSNRYSSRPIFGTKFVNRKRMNQACLLVDGKKTIKK